ncbi:MAG: DUF1549 domain-containing protein [Pirellulales bacterium]|nr:DUF1549 domain-containing protein [Pirellulales bacterium]
MNRVFLTLACALGLQTGWARAIDFDHDVVPILKKHCAQCHSGTEAKGGFSLNTRASFLEGEAAEVGDADASHFLELIRSEDPDLRMPPKEREGLPAKSISVLADWVNQGMPWTEGFSFAGNTYQPPLRPRKVTLPGSPHDHPIDRLLRQYLAERDEQWPAEVDDATFLRRASSDLNGLLPTVEQLEQFTSNPSANKRAELVDTLLANELVYAEHWLTFWNDLLRNDYAGTGFITGGRKQISRWLYRSLLENKPYDQFTRELVAPPSNESRGFIDGIKWRGTVSAGQTLEIQFAQSVAQSFLGINLKCASCHDSFIDRWKLADAYALAAVYSTEPLLIHRCDKPIGQEATAGWLFPELGQVDPAAPRQQRLQQLADLMTDKDNGRFSRTIVNRLWAQLMGRGIVHPLDAMHTRPWNEDLLDFLANYLVENDYDLKAVLRLIATSGAYASGSDHQAAMSAAGAPYVYRGPLVKRMTAEQFMDAVWQLTGAAPLQFDAPVVRGKLDDTSNTTLDLQAEWIWDASAKDGKIPAGGQQLVFRKTVELPAEVKSGVAVITADNAFELYVARREVSASQDWTRPQTIPLANVLKKGKNELVIVARNFLDTPNPAGLFFEARLKLADGTSMAIKSDSSWQVSAAAPRGSREGRLGTTAGPWAPATTLGRPRVYAAVESPLQGQLALGLTGVGAMVRASLLKSDFLMRSLGRPNRDQIVSSRPAELTTLEAIDLANGEALIAALKIGADRYVDRPDMSGQKLVEELFRAALSRAPTESERKTLVDAIGPAPTSEAVEDMLWAILMMPEFVMVR